MSLITVYPCACLVPVAPFYNGGLNAGLKPGNRFSAPALDRVSAFDLGNVPWRISRCPCSAERHAYVKLNKVRRDLPGDDVQTFLEWPRAGQGEPGFALMLHNVPAILKDPDQIIVPPCFAGHDFLALRSALSQARLIIRRAISDLVGMSGSSRLSLSSASNVSGSARKLNSGYLAGAFVMCVM